MDERLSLIRVARLQGMAAGICADRTIVLSLAHQALGQGLIGKNLAVP
jgi:hypothetical protein